MTDIRTGISIDTIKEILLNSGYGTIESSVHGKNQTRFTHLILEKDGQKFFCKVNNDNEVYDSQINQLLSTLLRDSPDGITFHAPVDTIEDDDHIFHIYPYVDQRPVSSESEDFTDFQVPESDVELYLQRVLAAIRYVEGQQMVSHFETRHRIPVEDTVIALLRQTPIDTPHAVEFLQYVLDEGARLPEYRLAIDDIQPQNMFWDTTTKHLTIFDLELLMPKKRCYDYAKFCAQLWVVYGRESYAQQFTRMLFDQLPAEEKGIVYSYFRYHMSCEALLYYRVFREDYRRERTVVMMDWIRRDLLDLVNH
jgi:hypothetical protein